MLLVLVKMCECGNKLSNVRSCILSSGKGLTSLNNNNRVTSRLNFLVKKKNVKMKLSDVVFLENARKR